MKRSVFLVPRLCASLILAGMFTPMTFAQTASNEAYVLDKVVQVSRHGVRPPTESNEKLLTAVTQRQWPTWLVPFGNLTGHGYTGAVEMGRYRGDVLRNAGLIPQGCPDAGQLLAHSSPMQRTKATAQALLDGMFPGCGFQPTYVRGSQDALFQANEMKFAALDPEKAKAVLKRIINRCIYIEKSSAPLIYIKSLDESSITVICEVYVAEIGKRKLTNDYLCTETLRQFAAEGIEIPFNQMDVSIKELKNSEFMQNIGTGLNSLKKETAKESS